MPTRRYITRLTKRDEGAHVVSPTDEEWRIRSVVKTTAGGRRRWEVYLQDPDHPGQYEKREASHLTNASWRWAEGHAPKERAPPPSLPSSNRAKTETKRDEDGRRLCDACGEPIFFIRLEGSGTAMPVDAGGIGARDVVEEADDLSKVTMITRSGRMLRGQRLRRAAEQDLTVYRSHFASCPDAEQFR